MNRFVNINEIARILNCSAKTVRRKVAKGVVPALQPDGPGTLLRFEVEEVLRAVRKQSAPQLEPETETKTKKEKLPTTKKKREKLSGSIPKWKQLLNAENKET